MSRGENRIEPHVYRAESFFSGDFPFAIRYEADRADEFNSSRRFRRKFWKITWIVSGSGNYIIGDLKFPFQPDTLIIVHPDACTTYEMEGKEIRLFNLLFSRSFLDDSLSELSDSYDFLRIFSREYERSFESPLYLLTANREIKSLIRKMYAEFEGNESNREALLKLYFMELILLILRRSGHKSDRNPEWTAFYAREYLRSHFQEEISQKDLAERLRITPERLCRIYREYYGHGMTRELLDLRLDHAASLLKTSDLCISEICDRSGFRDLRYFYRAFSGKFFCSPVQYRKNMGVN